MIPFINEAYESFMNMRIAQSIFISKPDETEIFILICGTKKSQDTI